MPARVLIDDVPAADWAVSWVTLSAGSHRVCFSDVPGFVTPPCRSVTVPAGGVATTDGAFQRLGLLQVKTEPAGLPSTIFVGGTARDDYGLYTFFEPGSHQVCWGDVAGWTAPACTTAVVRAGEQTTVTGTFTSGASGPGPAPALGPVGYLRVTTSPPVVSRISLDGVPRADWALTYLKVPVGDRLVCFTDVPGYEAPACRAVTIAAGATSTVNATFTQLGWLKVEVQPAGLPVDVVVNGTPRDQFGLYAAMEPGAYQVCGTTVADWATPACAQATVTAGQRADVRLTYTSTARFTTIPVGGTLPTDAQCAARVRKAPEVRPANATYNRTTGQTISPTAEPNNPFMARVTGSFTGTTDEIIQWTACKWGIEEDVVRAQIAKESYWFQRALGDFGTDPSRCVPGHPIGADGVAGQCPESIGLAQDRYIYMSYAFPGARDSSAMNLDTAYAVWRNCYEGGDAWLNTVERGKQYAAGDLWGCVGRWYSGRWYTAAANEYIAAVQALLTQRVWETPSFINYTG